jgi:two-component sensor histidine kinase/integral membrane sensor domain MASE1
MASDRVAEAAALNTVPARGLADAGPARVRTWPRQLVFAAFAAAISFLAARFGLALLAQPGGVALFWPSSGLAVGTLLALGRSAEMPMVAGVAAGVFAANATGDRSVPLALVFAAVNVMEFVLVARLAEGYFGSPFQLDTLRRVGGFFLSTCVGAGVSSLVATFAIFTLATPRAPLFEVWHEWFRSDVIGIIGIAPLLIGLRGEAEARRPARVHVEGALTLALVAVGFYLLFSVTRAPDRIWTHIPPVAVLFPFLLLIAARLPLVYASATVAIVTLVVVITTASGVGRFSEPHLPLSYQLLFAQMVIVSAAVCSLALAALVDERRAAEEHQRLLISQLDHRVKNSLALMEAVVERSQVSARTIGDFVASLGGRIKSMARTQSKLSTGRWQGLCLEGVIKDELSPYHTAGSDALVGPKVKLKPGAAQAISMVVHELATNAAKYGALSRSHGRVFVRWKVAPGTGGEQVLTLVWREEGGPRVVPPSHEGFGTSTIRNLLAYELGAEVNLRFEPSGVVCTITVPASAAISSTAGDSA